MDTKNAILLSLESMEFDDKHSSGRKIQLHKLNFLETGTNEILSFFVTEEKLLGFGLSLEKIEESELYWDGKLPTCENFFILGLEMRKSGFNQYKQVLVSLSVEKLD